MDLLSLVVLEEIPILIMYSAVTCVHNWTFYELQEYQDLQYIAMCGGKYKLNLKTSLIITEQSDGMSLHFIMSSLKSPLQSHSKQSQTSLLDFLAGLDSYIFPILILRPNF